MDPSTALLIAAAIAIALYLAAARHPLTKCMRCGGRGVLRSWLLPWRFRPCPRCKRKGEVRGRWPGKR